MRIYDYKKVHCIGIGGIGVSAIAKFFLLHGAHVSGSDLVESTILDELRTLGVEVYVGHEATHIPHDVELVVFSPAVTDENSEYLFAKSRGVALLSYPQALGEISKTRHTIAITGMHGKSTTTAMLGTIFEAQDPLVIVGSKVPGFNYGNVRFTKSHTTPFIVEACEYRGHMRSISPTDIVITNIEEEHMDYYKDLDHIVATFQEYAATLPPSGRLYRNIAEKNSENFSTQARIITYGVIGGADFRGFPSAFSHGARKIAIELRGEPLGKVKLNVPGIHNVYNALAAIACGISHDISMHDIAMRLQEFRGLWRRFEYVGQYQGVHVHSDYGHHPTEIRATLRAAREAYPDQRIMLVFQPHQHHRTRRLFNEFVAVLREADAAIIADIYDVAGREGDTTVSAQELVHVCASPQIIYGGDLEHTLAAAKNEAGHTDVLLVMGAGTIDWVARELVKKKMPNP